MKAPEAPDYDPNEIIPGIPLSIGDAWLEDTEWRLTLADALADVLQRACEAEQPLPRRPPPSPCDTCGRSISTPRSPTSGVTGVAPDPGAEEGDRMNVDLLPALPASLGWRWRPATIGQQAMAKLPFPG